MLSTVVFLVDGTHVHTVILRQEIPLSCCITSRFDCVINSATLIVSRTGCERRATPIRTHHRNTFIDAFSHQTRVFTDAFLRNTITHISQRQNHKFRTTTRHRFAGQQFNIDQASFGIESAKANIETVAAMKAANTALKKSMKNDMNIDGVEDIAEGKRERKRSRKS